MLRLILSRLLQLPLVLVVIFIITLTLAWVVPGDPLEGSEGRNRTPQQVEVLKRQYHLESPGSFLWHYVKGLVVGIEGHPPPYFGPSLQNTSLTVNEIIGVALPYSICLGLLALLFALIIGLCTGIIGAWRPGSPLDFASLGVALLGISLPSFVTAFALLILIKLVSGFAPIGNPYDVPGFAFWTASFWQNFGLMFKYLLVPALALSLAPAAYIARLIRLGLADVMSSDFIRTARAKGVSERNVLFKHALKVAFLPVLSFLGPAAAATMTGSFVVEQVFAINGIGNEFVDAVLNKDQFMILAVVLIYSTMLIVFNLIVDVAYAWIDPRIELDK